MMTSLRKDMPTVKCVNVMEESNHVLTGFLSLSVQNEFHTWHHYWAKDIWLDRKETTRIILPNGPKTNF